MTVTTGRRGTMLRLPLLPRPRPTTLRDRRRRRVCRCNRLLRRQIRAVSWAMDWLMVTIMPIFIRALTTSTPLTAILCAMSATVTTSGTKTSCTTGSVGAWKRVLVRLEFELLPFLPPRTRSSSPLRALLRSRPPFPPLPLALRLDFRHRGCGGLLFRFCRIDRFVFDGQRGCLRFLGRFGGTLSAGFGFLCGFCLLFCLLFHGFAACLAFLFLFQQGFLVGAKCGGTACFFIALRLFFRADHGLRHGRCGRFRQFFGIFAFAVSLVFRLSGFSLGSAGFLDGILSAWAFSALLSSAGLVSAATGAVSAFASVGFARQVWLCCLRLPLSVLPLPLLPWHGLLHLQQLRLRLLQRLLPSAPAGQVRLGFGQHLPMLPTLRQKEC